MRTKADTRLIVERLKKEYPVSECSLAYDDAWQLLVSVRLSAQCTDARVNIVTKDLFAKYPTLEALAAAGGLVEALRLQQEENRAAARTEETTHEK